MALQPPAPKIKNNGGTPSAEDLRLRRMLEMSGDDQPTNAPLDFSAPTKPRQPLKLSRNVLLGISLAVGLVVVSLALGWLLGSMNQPALAPWQSSPAYERMYVTWAAERYAKTGDAVQAQKDLAGPRREYLADLLTTMQKETSDTQKRQRLAALGDVMRPPPSETSFLPTLVAQPVFVLSLLLSFAPLLAAIGLVAVPYLQALRKPAVAEIIAAEPSEAALEELLADVKIEDPMARPADATEAAAQEEEKKKEEEEEERQEDQNSGLGDLASLFEEEDTSLSTLETFCKGMVDVNIDSLLANAKGVVQSFKEGHLSAK